MPLQDQASYLPGRLRQCPFDRIAQGMPPVNLLRLNGNQCTIFRQGVGEMRNGQQVTQTDLVYTALGSTGKPVHVRAGKDLDRARRSIQLRAW